MTRPSVFGTELEQSPARPRSAGGAASVAVVIPCYRVAKHVAGVIERIGPEVSLIVCVDDGCPLGSGDAAQKAAEHDPRVRVVRHDHNQGVGAAVLTGYRAALAEGAAAIVKLDGDGQMAPEDIPAIVAPILRGEADYVKGNRFFSLEHLQAMPWMRLIGNAGLSFLCKISSGYWNLFDPTNGFTAIHAAVAELLPFQKLSKRYFFESDMLFRLNTLRAVVVDVPLKARYADEPSSLNAFKELFHFPFCHLRNFAKRIFYNYLLRDFNIASVNLLVGAVLLTFGVVFGAIHWIRAHHTEVFASSGTVMVAALPIILGTQFLLSFIHFDVTSVPRSPIHRTLRRAQEAAEACKARAQGPEHCESS